MDEPETAAAGWTAIDATLARLYGDQEPKHYGTLISYSLGGPDPLDGISAYCRSGPIPHWHFVTYGFSDLYEKEGDNPEVSGYGFELTFRLRRSAEEDEPPAWSLNFLQNLARYVFSTGNAFRDGDHLDLNGPIALGKTTDITAIAFALDPELAPLSSPNGRLDFLQVVGLTTDEFRAVRRWNTQSFLALLSKADPLMTTGLDRASLLDDAATAATIVHRSRAEGSSTAHLFTDSMTWALEPERLGQAGVVVTMGTNAARQVADILPARVPHGRPLSLASEKHAVSFEPSTTPSWSADEKEHLRIRLTADAAATLAESLGEGVGDYAILGLPDLRFHVPPSTIRDLSGRRVREES